MSQSKLASQERSRSKWVLLRLLPAAVGAVGVAWLSVQSAAVAELARKQPQLASKIAPSDPRTRIALANLEFRLNRGDLSEKTFSKVVEVYGRTPLPEEPLLYAGIRAALNGNDRKAELLFREAARRAPRSRLARLFVLDRDLHAGRVADAAVGIGVLTRLVSETQRFLLPELAKLAKNPATRTNLSRALQSDPMLKTALLAHLVSTGVNIDLVLAMAGPNSFKTNTNKVPEWQSMLLARLVREGDVAQARALWLRLAGMNNAPTVFNPRFEPNPAPPPFNWRFTSGGGGVAEPSNGGALEVEYYDREQTELAGQLLVLSPGSYMLSMRMEGGARSDGHSSLSWEITCRSSEVKLVDIPVQSSSAAGALLKGRFTVPGRGCSAQWLRLVGEPSEFPKPITVTFTGLALQK